METDFKPYLIKIPSIIDCLWAIENAAVMQKNQGEKITDVTLATEKNVMYVSATTLRGEDSLRSVLRHKLVEYRVISKKDIHEIAGTIKIKNYKDISLKLRLTFSIHEVFIFS